MRELFLLFFFIIPTSTPALAGLPASSPSFRPQSQTPASPRLKRGEYISFKVKSQIPAVQIIPRVAPVRAKTTTYFEMTQINGQLMLRFQSKDPHLHLSRTHPLVIYLTSDPALHLQPFIILKGDWPKTETQMPIKATLDSKGGDHYVRGKATYTICSDQSKGCTKTQSSFFYPL